MTEQEFRAMIQATLKEDMKELLDGPMNNVITIIQNVYERGLMKGMEVQRKISGITNPQFTCCKCTNSEGNHVGDQCLCSHDGQWHKLGDPACANYREYVNQ